MATNKDFVVKNGLRVGEDAVITGNVSAANFVGNVTLDSTGVDANTYGSSSLIPIITVNTDGRISNVSTVSVAGVSDFTYESSNAQLVIATADGSSYTANVDLTAFSTSDLTEGTNQYYTVARANSAIDARVTQSFVNALNVTAAGVQADSVALGTDTTGNYVATISQGTGVTITGGTGESSTPSVAIGQDVSTSANVTFQDGTFTGDLQIDGDFTVSGNVVTISAVELAVEDNMIYLNANSNVTNPDLGWAGSYNDGVYAHAGFFRDATDGVFKAYDGYTPEPDASAFIDTSHGSFSLADIQANNFIGTLNGTANNATNLNGQAASYYLDFDNFTNLPDPVITLGGDLTGSVTLTNLANGTLTATVSDNSHNHTVSNISDFTSGANTAIDNRVTKSFVDALNVDADTLDGVNSTSFLRSDAVDTGVTLELLGGSTFDPSGGGTGTETATDVGIALSSGTRIVGTYNGYIRTLIEWNSSSDIEIGQNGTSLIGGINLKPGNAGDAKVNGNRILTTADEGTGNGLDADTVDGLQASQFLRSDASDSTSGDLTVSGGNLYVGVNDSVAGIMTLYGAGTGTSEGAEIQLYASADYDSVIERWSIDVYQDDLRMFTSAGDLAFVANPDGAVNLYYNGSKKFETSSVGATLTGDLIVSGGDITLSGTGRISGIDTVSAGTDAANKDYVDNAVAGVSGGGGGGGTAQAFSAF